jgi:Right handed beta helix region
MTRRLVILAVLLGFLAGAAPASAHHVACGDTITQDTTLDSDLLDCSANGIIIGADNITLNLNGHTVTGTRATGFYYAGVVLSSDNATVRNGTLERFEHGVQISGDDNLVRRVSASNNELGIFFGVSAGPRGNRIERSVISDNEGGIFLSDAGAMGPPAGGNVIRRNTIVGNTFTGVGAIETYNTHVVRNRVLGNGHDGIWMGGDALRNVIEGNTSNGNGDDGIEIEGGIFGAPELSNEVTRNTANDNGDLGIQALEYPGELFVIDGGGNRASGNGNPLQCVVVVCS